MDFIGLVNIMVLGLFFVVEVVRRMELMVGCIVRLALWHANRRGYFMCCFNLMSVEMNEMSMGGCLFGIVIWADFFIQNIIFW